jgi:hypothetical protein
VSDDTCLLIVSGQPIGPIFNVKEAQQEGWNMCLCKYAGFGVSGEKEDKVTNRIAGALKRAITIASIVL